MTKKQDLHVVKTTTTVDEGTSMFYSILLCDLLYSFIYLSLIIFFWILALEALVNNRISGLPVIDEDWNLVIVYFPSHFFLLYYETLMIYLIFLCFYFELDSVPHWTFFGDAGWSCI